MQHLIDLFCSQREYIDDYTKVNGAFRFTESMHWFVHAGLVGVEWAHVFSFRKLLLRSCELADITDMHKYGEQLDEWLKVATLPPPTTDGLVGVGIDGHLARQ